MRTHFTEILTFKIFVISLYIILVNTINLQYMLIYNKGNNLIHNLWYTIKDLILK